MTGIDPLNRSTQVLQLSVEERSKISLARSAAFRVIKRVKGNPVEKSGAVAPALWFKFDEGQGDQTQEESPGQLHRLPGQKTFWKQGVSGTALEFDGYNTGVSVPAAKARRLSGGSLTLEGWLALGAYPWNWAPIVQQGDDDGYFLGVDSHGYPGFMVKVDGVWQQLSVPNKPPYTDANHLAVFRWYHVGGHLRQHEGMMRLYLNGQEVAAKPSVKAACRRWPPTCGWARRA